MVEFFTKIFSKLQTWRDTLKTLPRSAEIHTKLWSTWFVKEPYSSSLTSSAQRELRGCRGRKTKGWRRSASCSSQEASAILLTEKVKNKANICGKSFYMLWQIKKNMLRLPIQSLQKKPRGYIIIQMSWKGTLPLPLAFLTLLFYYFVQEKIKSETEANK